ncbi:MAG TPA: hypothetical protein VHG08_14385, partial [Longimicrobium sp.]|nr:hypothetical protein [Longimicrobium sp.]
MPWHDFTQAGTAAPLPDREWRVEEVARLATLAAERKVPVHRLVREEPPPADSAAAGEAAEPAPDRVSGLYRSDGEVQVHLRVDVDGRRPTLRVSADVFEQTGATLHYRNSFRVDQLTLDARPDEVVVEGDGTFQSPVDAPRVRVTLRRGNGDGHPSARLELLTPGGELGAAYDCAFASDHFRAITLEVDQVASVTPFTEYDTASVPAPEPARVLSIARAYEEAGIEVRMGGQSNVVPDEGVGAWSDAELHDAMLTHFSLQRHDAAWYDAEGWSVWLLHARRHEKGYGGIMFDQDGRQRQGCAVFHDGMGETEPGRTRYQLYTCVHELGHCFNLYHSFAKNRMRPPQPNRHDALSWMNYPTRYQGAQESGPEAFWRSFAFDFDGPELVHLRHGFYRDVVFGGAPFGEGAALEAETLFTDPVEDRSGLRLELRGRTTYDFGEPVVPEIKLSIQGDQKRQVIPHLHPNAGYLQIAIRRPGGVVSVYRPLIEHCVVSEPVSLNALRPALYESAFISYGKDGAYFGSPGMYQLRAVYLGPDGSQVVSNTLPVRVRTPLSQEDDRVAELYLGDEQGQIFYLQGSESDHLRRGNDALETVMTEHSDHRLATYARMVHGHARSREFKRIRFQDAGGERRVPRLEVRPPVPEESIPALRASVQRSMELRDQPGALDNITLGETSLRLAHTCAAAGDRAAALA